jgi:hypothetical protein
MFWPQSVRTNRRVFEHLFLEGPVLIISKRIILAPEVCRRVAYGEIMEETTLSVPGTSWA